MRFTCFRPRALCQIHIGEHRAEEFYLLPPFVRQHHVPLFGEQAGQALQIRVFNFTTLPGTYAHPEAVVPYASNHSGIGGKIDVMWRFVDHTKDVKDLENWYYIGRDGDASDDDDTEVGESESEIEEFHIVSSDEEYAAAAWNQQTPQRGGRAAPRRME